MGGELVSETVEAVPQAHHPRRDYGYRPNLVLDAAVHEYLCQAYGPAQFAKICLALTRPCITSTVRVNTLQTTTQKVMEYLRRHLHEASMRIVEPFGAQIGGPTSEQETVSCPVATYPISPSVNSQVARVMQEFGAGGENEAFADDARRAAHDSSRAVGGGIQSNGELINDICWEHPVLKDVVVVSGQGPCEVDSRGNGDERTVKEVVVSRKCAEAVLRGANVFVPGVLACSLHVEEGDEVAVTVAVERRDSTGAWCVGITRGTTLASEHAKAQLGESTRDDWFIGKGRVTMSRAALFKQTQGVAVEMTKRIFQLPPFHGLLKGQIFLQNLPSIVAARVLDPKPGERILDMCAAPGGKTTAIAILMEDKGEIIALDRSHRKVLDIKRLSEEMKLTCIQAYKMDATKAVTRNNFRRKEIQLSSQPLSSVDNVPEMLQLDAVTVPIQPLTQVHPSSQADEEGSWPPNGAYTSQAAARKQSRKIKNMSKRGQIGASRNYVKAFQPQSFDRVLLDAPCSALGLRPRLFAGEETLEGLRNHACYQRKMLDQAVQLVRPGGTLVYSTCTLNPGENEAVVRYALDTYDFLSLVPQVPRIGGPGLIGGLDVFDGTSHKEWLRKEEKDLVQRFCPMAPYDTTGFFIAKFAVDSIRGQFDCQTTAPADAEGRTTGT